MIGMVENIGFEPMTSCVRCKRSSQAELIPRAHGVGTAFPPLSFVYLLRLTQSGAVQEA